MPTEFFYNWNALLLQGDRDRQEDAFQLLLSPGRDLHIALADGVGGFPNGDRASRCAVQSTIDRLAARTAGQLPTPTEWLELLFEVGQAIEDLPVTERRAFGEPASTLIAGTLCLDGSISMVSVGDSSAWLIQRSGQVERLFGRHGSGPWMRFAMGVDNRTCDYFEHHEVQLSDRDRLVLASDGIQSLTEVRLEALFREPFECVLPEIALAIARDAQPFQDNVAIVLIETVGVEYGDAEPPGSGAEAAIPGHRSGSGSGPITGRQQARLRRKPSGPACPPLSQEKGSPPPVVDSPADDPNAAEWVARRVLAAIAEGQAIEYTLAVPDREYPEICWSVLGLPASGEIAVLARVGELHLGKTAASHLLAPPMGDRAFGIDAVDGHLARQLSGELWQASARRLVAEAIRLRKGQTG